MIYNAGMESPWQPVVLLFELEELGRVFDQLDLALLTQLLQQPLVLQLQPQDLGVGRLVELVRDRVSVALSAQARVDELLLEVGALGETSLLLELEASVDLSQLCALLALQLQVLHTITPAGVSTTS